VPPLKRKDAWRRMIRLAHDLTLVADGVDVATLSGV
jgi:hypothetical protein